jgi:membrane fusion protein, multidrug efflux system
VRTRKSHSQRADRIVRRNAAPLALFILALGVLPTVGQTPTKLEAVRGIVRASEQAMISTDLLTRVVKIGFQEGERFKAGDVIVEFDCRKQRAELAAAQAQLLEMTLTLDKFRVLQRAQAAGKNEIEISEARVAKATAEADGLKAHLSQCTLIAPYNGRVMELTLHPHESPQQNKPYIGIVSEGALEIDLIVPSEWARWLKVGETFTFVVDETKTTHDIEVKRIGAAVDAISQTLKIVAGFSGGTQSVLPGMSGVAQFSRAGG